MKAAGREIRENASRFPHTLLPVGSTRDLHPQPQPRPHADSDAFIHGQDPAGCDPPLGIPPGPGILPVPVPVTDQIRSAPLHHWPKRHMRQPVRSQDAGRLPVYGVC